MAKLWVIATGGSSGNDGRLFRLNATTLQIEDEIELGVNPGTDLELSPDKSTLIYHAGTSIFKMAITSEAAPEEAWITATDVDVPYALGVHPVTGDVYFGDAVDYARSRCCVYL